jgi:NADH:ubiquinone oxidoreductase subunit 5 (subunit L)/multisubunit Na+/H+ antiporter MnhA subunit
MFAYFEWLAPALLLCGALLNALLGQNLPRRAQNGLACGTTLAAFLAALPLLAGQIMAPGLVGKPRPLPWFKVWTGTRFIEAPLALRIDTLSTWMSLTMLLVGLVLQARAARRLADGPSRHISLALLSGTLTATLLVLLADNLICLFLGWSLAGWCAWGLMRSIQTPGQTDRGSSITMPLALTASDLCLLLAIGMVSSTLQSADMDSILALDRPAIVPSLAPREQLSIVMLLILAAAIRTVPFPSYVWNSCRAASTASVILHTCTVLLPPLYLVARLQPLILPHHPDQPRWLWLAVTAGVLIGAGLNYGLHSWPRTSTPGTAQERPRARAIQRLSLKVSRSALAAGHFLTSRLEPMLRGWILGRAARLAHRDSPAQGIDAVTWPLTLLLFLLGAALIAAFLVLHRGPL